MRPKYSKQPSRFWYSVGKHAAVRIAHCKNPNRLRCCCCSRYSSSTRYSRLLDLSFLAASPTIMGKSGAPRWDKPTSIPDQRFIYPLGGARRSFLAHAVPKEPQGGSLKYLSAHALPGRSAAYFEPYAVKFEATCFPHVLLGRHVHH